KLLGELKSRGAWFATAAQTVSWFRNRRLAAVESGLVGNGKIRIKASLESDGSLPGFRVRVHKPGTRKGTEDRPAQSSPAFVDMAFKEKIDTEINL
ncbi:MAG: hypothetical protein WBW41_15025, partial [Verrucomicrobiia bacterium]